MRRLLVILAGLVMLGGALTAITVTALPAHAVTLYGLCTPGSKCARETGSYFDWWPRDISGDTNQQMSRSYQGQVSSQRCWPFNCGGGLNAAYDGASVWKIFNINTGRCMVSNHVAGDQKVTIGGSCNDNGSNWVWDGSVSNAALINVYMSNWDCPRPSQCFAMALDVVSLYGPLETLDNGQQPFASTWGLVPVIG
jgi:hypothetical protein